MILHSQRVLTSEKSGRAIHATLGVIEHLGYIQIDTISVIQRAHHHTLWNRNPRYKNIHLDDLQQQGKIFEYWSHAAACLPMADYRFYQPHKNEIARGRKLWYECDPKVKQQVLRRITAEGPLQAKDFERKERGRLAMWEWKPAKYALEQLFMEGRLMVARRQGFQKVYDLACRVLPHGVNTTMPSTEQWYRFLIERYLRAHGLGQAAEIAYLRPGRKPVVQHQLNLMQEEGRLVRVRVADEFFYAIPAMLEWISKPVPRAKLKLLSPFDNFVIQRRRLSRLFDFDYQIECYVPEARRKYGYFCLPIIWNAALSARMDCKADRKSSTFIIKNLVLEPRLENLDGFTHALEKELRRFMVFNDCRELVIGRVSDQYVRQSLGKRFK